LIYLAIASRVYPALCTYVGLYLDCILTRHVQHGQLDPRVARLLTLMQAAGLRKIRFHDLPRTCARNAFNNGATLPQVQTMLGDSDAKTTMRYIGSQEDDDNTAVDFIH
jgi:integrase